MTQASTNSTRLCELCNIAEAVLFCPADSAFLCYLCDATVHSVNFLVARHRRYSLHLPKQADSSSSTCTQSSTSQKKLDCVISSTNKPSDEMRSKALKIGDGVFLHWCNKIGLCEGEIHVVRRARDALAICLDKLRPGWPFRVCLAACIWLGLRFTAAQRSVKSVEQISGVPAKLILAAELKLQRLVKASNKPRRPQVLVEGWDETSPCCSEGLSPAIWTKLDSLVGKTPQRLRKGKK